MKVEAVELFLDEFTAWASAQADILGVALVGSFARNAASDTSDVDLVILAREPKRFLDDQSWVGNFGEASRRQIEEYGLLTSLRVWYADGREIEYGITTEAWGSVPLDKGTQRVISDGMRVLFERGQLLSRHQAKA